MIPDLVTEAAARWGLDPTEIRFVADRENQVYRVSERDRSLALRLHRPGYRSHIQIRSELDWMAALAEGGIRVPTPVRSTQGNLLETVQDTDVDVLVWLDGSPLSQSKFHQRAAAFQAVAAAARQLHQVSDRWAYPEGFERPAWDAEGLVGERPLWGPFWAHPSLSDSQKALILQARTEAAEQLQRLQPTLDFGLIHADLVRENVLITEGHPAFLDFDDGGFGFRMFEYATILQHVLDDPDYPEISAAVLDAAGQPDREVLSLFILLRSWTYLGWVIPRLYEAGGAERSDRFLRRAVSRSRAWLDGKLFC